jgi:hypothetical protein
MQQNQAARVLATLFFIGLLVCAVVLNKRSVTRQGGSVVANSAEEAGGSQYPVPAAPDAMERYGFKLTEVSKTAGVEFTHQPPKLDAKLSHIIDRVADMGAAVAIADFDRDGWPDFYVTNSAEGGKNHLYHNNHDGTFTDVAEQMGVAAVNSAESGVSMGAVWGDYDDDGYEDLLVYKWGKCQLFHNENGKGFKEAVNSGVPQWMNANAGIWLDYDNDGKLDLLLGGYFDEKLDLWKLPSGNIMPDSIEYATNGTRLYLLKGRGDGTFEDVTVQVGLDKHKAWTLAAVAVDMTGDTYPDIFLANDYGKAELWRNIEGKRFENVSVPSGVGDRPKSGMNAAVGDIFNDGKFSIYVSNITEDHYLLQGNNMWVPSAAAKPGELMFENQANGLGVENGGWSFGAQFGDLNNDGFQDIYLVNGYLSGTKESYWYDYATFAGGNQSIIRDAAKWIPIKGRSLSGYQPKRVWLNDGAGRFTEVAQAVGASDRFDGRAVALADLWNRGSLDILASNQRGPLLVYKNEVRPENHWISFELEGVKSNRSAIGAITTVYWNGQKQSQFVSGGVGFCAQNDRRLHFGLGKSVTVEKVEIRWPSGIIQTITSPATDKLHRIRETSASG